MAEGGEDARRRAAVAEYRKKLLSCRELEARAKTGNAPPPPPNPPASTRACMSRPVCRDGFRCSRVVIAIFFFVVIERRCRVLAGSIWVRVRSGGSLIGLCFGFFGGAKLLAKDAMFGG